MFPKKGLTPRVRIIHRRPGDLNNQQKLAFMRNLICAVDN